MIQKVAASRSGLIPFKIRNSCRCPAAMFRRPLKAHWWTCFLFAFCLLTLAHTITSTESRYFYNLCSAGLPLLFSSVVEATFGPWFILLLFFIECTLLKWKRVLLLLILNDSGGNSSRVRPTGPLPQFVFQYHGGAALFFLRRHNYTQYTVYLQRDWIKALLSDTHTSAHHFDVCLTHSLPQTYSFIQKGAFDAKFDVPAHDCFTKHNGFRIL